MQKHSCGFPKGYFYSEEVYFKQQINLFMTQFKEMENKGKCTANSVNQNCHYTVEAHALLLWQHFCMEGV